MSTNSVQNLLKCLMLGNTGLFWNSLTSEDLKTSLIFDYNRSLLLKENSQSLFRPQQVSQLSKAEIVYPSPNVCNHLALLHAAITIHYGF